MVKLGLIDSISWFFTAGIEIVGGVPQVIWSPNLNTNGIARIYTICGKAKQDG